VEPGLVAVDRWRPDAPGNGQASDALACLHVGVGRRKQ
jgi:hypothetical protein